MKFLSSPRQKRPQFAEDGPGCVSGARAVSAYSGNGIRRSQGEITGTKSPGETTWEQNQQHANP